MQAGNAAIPDLNPDDESTDGEEDPDIPWRVQHDFERINAGTPLFDVYHVCQEVRLQHPMDTASYSDMKRATRELIMIGYKKDLPGGPLQVSFYAGVVNPVEQITVSVEPANVFQEKILPGILCFQAQMETRGFLNPPANTIPFTSFQLCVDPGGLPKYEFTLTGSANITAATRLLLNNLVFVDRQTRTSRLS